MECIAPISIDRSYFHTSTKNMKTSKFREDSKYFFLSAFDCVYTKGMILPGLKLLIFFLTMVNCYFSSAVWIGWPSLLSVYKNEGVYSFLCPPLSNITSTNVTVFFNNATTSNTTLAIGCSQQSDRFNLVYTLTSSFYYIGYLFFGFILDYGGPKVANMTSNFLIFLGSTFLVFYKCNH
jgi:hypothetical protein